MRRDNYKISIPILLFILGVIYLKIITTTITTDGSIFTIYSRINQNANFHIKTEYKKSKLICNGKIINIDIDKEHDYFYRGEEQITILLHKGDNICKAQYINKIKQKITFIDFIILFILMGISLFILLFYLFISILKRFNLTKSGSSQENNKIKVKWIFFIVIALGVVIRLLYFNKYGIMLFQHDWQGHINLIKYMAQNYSMPNMPNKGWEYPQQPLYYIITAIIYNLFLLFDFTPKEALHYGVGNFSLLCSAIFLIFSYKLLEILTQNRWIQIIAMLFLALTPSLVYMSARVNNDTLVMALSVIALFFAIKSYQYDFNKYFYSALISVSLLFLTKISTAPIELFLFTLLIINYIRTKRERELLIFSFVGFFLLSLTLWHLYTPLSGGFYMVNSAKFPKQTIEHLNSSYFLSFHIFDLIKEGYSHVFGADTIRYSFPTYQYGTMFFGEFDYKYFFSKNEYILSVMKSTLFLGLLYPLGFIGYLVNLYREIFINRLLFIVLLINLALILKFIFSYPSICNSDFRYFVPSFTILGFIFAKGLYYISSYHRWTWYIINILLGLLFGGEIIFFYLLI